MRAASGRARGRFFPLFDRRYFFSALVACSAFRCAFGCPLGRLLLHASDERTQSRRRHRPTQWAWRPSSWQRRRNVDLGEAPVRLDVLAASHDAAGKGDARLAAHEFTNCEPLALLRRT